MAIRERAAGRTEASLEVAFKQWCERVLGERLAPNATAADLEIAGTRAEYRQRQRDAERQAMRRRLEKIEAELAARRFVDELMLRAVLPDRRRRWTKRQEAWRCRLFAPEVQCRRASVVGMATQERVDAQTNSP